MDYTFMLCFDDATETYFNSIMSALANSNSDFDLGHHDLPPHISIACFQTEKLDTIINEVDKNISEIKSGGISWASLGVFVPYVLFAAPVMNVYLLNACETINRLIKPFSTVGDNGNYLPYKWVPHTTLSFQRNHDELNEAFAVASREFSAILGKSTRLLLGEFSPF